MNLVGWIANVCLIVSFYLINHRHRSGFLWSLAGNLAWLWEGVRMDRVDLAFVCVVFVGLAIHGWWRWGKETRVPT